jgi:hypothetical protein
MARTLTPRSRSCSRTRRPVRPVPPRGAILVPPSVHVRWRTAPLGQAGLAERIRSSQSRVAKMEADDPAVSIDLLVRSLFALGATNRDLARTISHAVLPKAS